MSDDLQKYVKCLEGLQLTESEKEELITLLIGFGQALLKHEFGYAKDPATLH